MHDLPLLGAWSVSREENKYLFWQLYSCKSHKDNWGWMGCEPGDPTSKSCPIGENCGIYFLPAARAGGARKRSKNLCCKWGKERNPGHDSSILIFLSLETRQDKQSFMMTDNTKLIIEAAVILWLWSHYNVQSQSTLQNNIYCLSHFIIRSRYEFLVGGRCRGNTKNKLYTKDHIKHPSVWTGSSRELRHVPVSCTLTSIHIHHTSQKNKFNKVRLRLKHSLEFRTHKH